ncbi:hypothetical protein [Nocardioides cynanchi]|uniref:hypothetical protein n=1 Tax=Nocardioides cynanchi TaxID=2558918 RepID=UPI0012445540|nr:hypothetical protein [Nocardioides cynanchi]
MKLSDDQLLEAVARLYADHDPAPDDLADGVLARLAVEDLEDEWELLTLVERVDLAAGVRSAEDAVAEDGDDATVALEFAGTSYRVLVRISTVDGHRRIDGWVVPAVPMKVFLGPPGDALAHSRQSAVSDEDGRFEFTAPHSGEARLWLLPQTGDQPDDSAAPPFVTPPFLI